MRRLVRFIRFSKVDVATLPANLLDAVVSAAYLAITPELKVARHSASLVRRILLHFLACIRVVCVTQATNLNRVSFTTMELLKTTHIIL